MSAPPPRSTTTVALLADVPSTGHVGETRARRFAMHGDGIGERSAAFVTFAREQGDAGRKIVALYPAWQASDAERAINFARGALRTDHIAGISLDLCPLALSLISDQLAYLTPYLPPGMIAALCDELPKHVLAGAWLRTVSGLATIPTSVKQHMGSFAPSVSFLAYCAPTHHVTRLRASDIDRTLPFRPVQPVQLLCSTPDPAGTAVFDDNLPRAIQPVATRTLPAQPLGPEYWGTTKYVEFVALSAHPQALTYAASSIRASHCSWCGERVAAKPCLFCGANATRTPAPPDRQHPPSHQNGHGPSRPERARTPSREPTAPPGHQQPSPAAPPQDSPFAGHAPPPEEEAPRTYSR